MSAPSSSSSPLISTRRRACTACQQAKRRCDQRLPRCGRCTQKGFEDCNYPSLEAAVAAADFNFFTDVLSGSAGTPTDSLHNIMPVPGVPETESSWSLFYGNAAAVPTPSPSVMAPPTSECIQRDAVLYCNEQFRCFPRRWAGQNGVAPFIHPALYLPTTNGADGLPPVLQDCFCACAAYAAKNEENSALVLGVVEAKATALLYVPEQATWTLPQQVAALQALVMYQIMRWFDGDIRQRVLADSVEPVLAAWTSALQSRVGAAVFVEEAIPPSVIPEAAHVPPQQQSSSSTSSYPQQHDISPDNSRSNTPGGGGGGRLTKEELKAAWRRWLMAEWIRRVLVMAHLVRAVYAAAKHGGGYGKLGGPGAGSSGGGGGGQHHGGGGGHPHPHSHHHHHQALGLSDMGFTAQTRLWAATTPERWNRSREGDTAWWVSRMDFSGLLALADPREVDEFTVMLSVVFRGKDTVEDWITHGPGGM
ncbi:C6 finger domain-containing protein [Colletotrichum tofieldiae]|uniref:C6 finger domain-containing protein n=1 Tax=Colletotrichum tofieldiae TaxID=708197 RepID=A0A161W5B4_9PEZI|nr:C6 finger domain-containing protein [Colletotrichum tofieldiae]